MSKTYSNYLIAAAILLITTEQLQAAGFQSTTQSAAGVGRANAGEAVIADTAAVLGRNPAAMMYFDQPEISVGVNFVGAMTDVTDASANGLGQSVPIADDEVSSIRPVPNVYYIHPLNKRVAVGAALFSNFGTGTEFSDEFNQGGVLQHPDPAADPVPALGGLVGGKTEMTTINLNFSVAVQVVEAVSLGFGLDVVYGKGTFERPTYAGGKDIGAGLSFEGDGWTAGWDVGLMYEVNERNRFGFSYHSGMDFTAEGDGSFKGVTFDEIRLSLPAMAEFSGFHQVAEAWAVHYSIQWIGWSAFDKIEFGDLLEKEYNWTNSGRYAIGTTYTIGKSWAWRAGLAFDETPVEEEYRSVSIPDSNRIWYSTGATWATASKRHSVDMAFTYLQGEELEVNETAVPALVVNANTKTNAIILGVNYNHRF